MFKRVKTILWVATVVLVSSMWTLPVTAGQKEETTATKQPVELEELVVTATRAERAVDMTSQPITIINKEAIETRNAVSVLELLDDVPGISISRSGPTGGQISIRGFNSNDAHSPLFIDGDRFHGRTTLEYMLIDPDRIERIEVIRGPASAMYGTDAMAGMVNVITRKAQGDVNQSFRLQPRLRSLDYSSASNLRSGTIELEGVGNGLDMLLGVSGKKTDDYRSPKGDIPNSDMESYAADLRIGYTLAPGHRVEMTGKYMDVEQGQAGGIGGAPGYPYRLRRQDPLTEKMLKLHYEGLNKALGIEHIEASLFVRRLYTELSTELLARKGNVTKARNYVDGPTYIGGKLFGVRPWWGKNTLTAGLDWYHEHRNALEQESVTYNAQGQLISSKPKAVSSPWELQKNIGLFMHNDWDPSEKWTVSVSGRLDVFITSADVKDSYTGEDETKDYPVTGGIGLIYRPIPIIHFTGNVNTSYKIPTPFAKCSTGIGYEPNPDLDPEKGITYEVGMRLRLPQIKANLTAFQSDYDDLIINRYVNSTIYPGTQASQAQNVGKARTRGVELDVVWSVNNRWKAFMNAAYLHGTDLTNDKPLSYIAPLNGLVGVRYVPDSKAFYIEATNRWSTQKHRIDDAQERRTGGYSVLSLYAGYSLQKLLPSFPDMQLHLAFENILDKAYRNPTTVEDIAYARSITNPLLEPGRSISVSLKSSF